MKQIRLSDGSHALVDDDLHDYLISLGPWICWKSPTRPVRYAQCHVWRRGKRTTLRMHRAVYEAKTGSAPPLIDHRDLNGLNNQFANLRHATDKQSSQHRRKQSGRRSKYKGVTWRSNRGKWVARIYDNITVSGHRGRSLGHFEQEIEAARAYDRAALASYGEFALLNFPRSDYENQSPHNYQEGHDDHADP